MSDTSTATTSASTRGLIIAITIVGLLAVVGIVLTVIVTKVNKGPVGPVGPTASISAPMGPIFSATKQAWDQSVQTQPMGALLTVTFPKVEIDTNGGFSPDFTTYTVPLDGFYFVNFSVYTQLNSGMAENKSCNAFAILYHVPVYSTLGTEIRRSVNNVEITNTATYALAGSMYVSLKKGDQLYIKVAASNAINDAAVAILKGSLFQVVYTQEIPPSAIPAPAFAPTA